jgi:chromosome segregation ATPase
MKKSRLHVSRYFVCSVNNISLYRFRFLLVYIFDADSDFLTTLKTQSVIRSSRQAALQVDQKRAELDTLLVEIRTSERNCEEMKRQERDLEMSKDNASEAIRALEVEKEHIKRDIIEAKRQEEDCRHQYQLIRASIEADERLRDELRRRVAALTDEETSLRESETKLRGSCTAVRQSIVDGEIEIEKLRNAADRERRSLMDIRTAKGLLEADLRRSTDDLKLLQEQAAAEAQRRIEFEAAAVKAREECGRVQLACAQLQRKMNDGSRVVEERKRIEDELRASHENIRLQVENQVNEARSETALLETLRVEHRHLALDMRRSKEQLASVQQQVQLEEATAQLIETEVVALRDTKVALEADISRLRDINKSELKRSEKLEQSCGEIEKRLKHAHEEIFAVVGEYERSRILSKEEENRVAEQRRSLKATMEELATLEKSVAVANSVLQEQRRQGLVELGQFDIAKQSIQSNMFLAAEAQRRADSGRQNLRRGDGLLALSTYNSDASTVLQKMQSSAVPSMQMRRSTAEKPALTFPVERGDLNIEMEKLRQQSSAIFAEAENRSMQ